MPTTQTIRRDKTYVPSPDEIAQAKRLFDQLEDDLAETGMTLLTSASGQIMELPPTMFDVLRFVGANLAAGNGVTIVPRATKLTTQEAADFLGISRPTLVKLLESGVMPFDKVGRHRRVTLDNLLDYQEREQARRRTVLAKAARNNQESGML
ncbi:MAG: helix-turn-helix domain-containing protein, partial [Propionibacteriaceae bacterium]|nr:helix-turn-helix domain-containing protein [Propionibacteriaceae bacterium]